MESIIGSQHDQDDDEDVVGGADADNADDDEQWTCDPPWHSGNNVVIMQYVGY